MIDPSVELTAAYIAAASALVASAIAGLFSLAGLFISKEQDTSKFRQAWIDELRKDIASLIAHAYQIHAYLLLAAEADYVMRWKATREDYVELNRASTRIKLRLNRDECESRLILKSLSEMEGLFKELKLTVNRTDISLEKIDSIATSLERDAPPLLKKEWVRVKEGEPIYRYAKWSAGILLIASAITSFYFFSRLLR